MGPGTGVGVGVTGAASSAPQAVVAHTTSMAVRSRVRVCMRASLRGPAGSHSPVGVRLAVVQERGHVAFDPKGRLFVVTHDEELLVHDGDSEAPLWRESVGETIAGVAISGDELVAVGEDGAVRRFTFLHRELPRASVGAGVRSFALSASGTVAAAHDEHVSLLRKNDLASVSLYHRGVSALAWSRDGTKLLLARSKSESDHALVLLDGANGEPIGEPCVMTGPVSAIAPSARGFLVACGDRVLRFTKPEVALEHVTRARDRKITDVACTPDGGRFALQLERSQVYVLSDPPSETLLDVKYPERVTSGVSFGQRPWIAIALAGGDANKVNADTGAMHRSDTHPGRTHNRWMVSIAGAFQKKQAEAAAAAAPAPKNEADEAKKRERQRAAQRALEDADVQLRQEQADQADRKMMIHVGMIALGILIGVLRACSHSNHY